MQTSNIFRTASKTNPGDGMMCGPYRQMTVTPLMQVHVYRRDTLVGGVISLDRDQALALSEYLRRWAESGWEVP